MRRLLPLSLLFLSGCVGPQTDPEVARLAFLQALEDIDFIITHYWWVPALLGL